MRRKYPLIITPNSDSKNKFRVATSIGSFFEAERSVRQDMEYVAKDYTLVVDNLHHLLTASFENGKRDPRTYWLAGDIIIDFLERIDDLGFFLYQQNRTLGRDAGVSESSIKKMATFRRRFLNISQVDPSVPWSRYRNNAIPRKRNEAGKML